MPKYEILITAREDRQEPPREIFCIKTNTNPEDIDMIISAIYTTLQTTLDNWLPTNNQEEKS